MALQRTEEAGKLYQSCAMKIITASMILEAMGITTQEQAWFQQKPEYQHNMFSLEADTAAYTGHLRAAQKLTTRAADFAIRAENDPLLL